MYHFGLLGYPLSHSLSPALHKAALSEFSLEGEYLLYPVQSGEKELLANLLGKLRAGDLDGLNVTIPYKQVIVPLLDSLTPAAKAIGAVNTIVLRDGRLVGENTDAPGFLADLERTLWGPDRQPGKALVLGAGGAARAVVYGLLSAGWNVIVAARHVEQAQTLITEISYSQNERLIAISKIAENKNLLAIPFCRAISYTFDELAALLSGIDLIVNATPVGMLPNTESSPWLAGLDFPRGACVYDLVYNPRETMLVRHAREAGLKAVAGLGMLVEQAGLAFETWTGRKPSREAMFAAVDQV